jgi:hypothetical protein
MSGSESEDEYALVNDGGLSQQENAEEEKEMESILTPNLEERDDLRVMEKLQYGASPTKFMNHR